MHSKQTLLLCLCSVFSISVNAVPSGLAEPAAIQDNSFLVEEAYNQEQGVVQHISTFTRMWNSKDWSYSFTQEWPGPKNWRHQFGYTLVGMHAGGSDGSGSGFGDTIFHYRYQLFGSGQSRIAFAPRFSLLFPSGDATLGRGWGGTGVQTNLPLSIVLHPRLITHWNAGATLVSHAQNSDGQRASSAGYNLGQSFIFVAHPRVHLMLETSANVYQAVVRRGKTEWMRADFVSPGVRWAFHFQNGLQIVPGVAVPLAVGGGEVGNGLLLYLSLEHPFSKSAEQ